MTGAMTAREATWADLGESQWEGVKPLKSMHGHSLYVRDEEEMQALVDAAKAINGPVRIAGDVCGTLVWGSGLFIPPPHRCDPSLGFGTIEPDLVAR